VLVHPFVNLLRGRGQRVGRSERGRGAARPSGARMSAMADSERDERPASFLSAMKTIGWAFFGVRARKGHEHDLSRLRPVHVIAAGLLGAFLFVMILVLVIASVT